jgi:hypothetical protein
MISGLSLGIGDTCRVDRPLRRQIGIAEGLSMRCLDSGSGE